MERPTFSPFWHRVRTLRPRLRPHTQITRQHYRGRRWHVVHDPASNQFYRLSPVAHDFVCTLDGVRNVEEAWKLALAKFGDSAPTQNEVIELLGQLYNSNLLSVDTTPETEQLLARGRERTKKRIAQQAIGIMYFRLRLFNPDRILTWVEPLLRPLLNRWGFIAWCLFVGLAVLKIIPEWPALVGQFDTFTSPANFGPMLAIFVLLKLLHELGHGVICKRFGGQVPEFGVMLLVLFPSPYVDASACWAFPSKWQRIAVGAGGMLFELAIAAAAAFIWLGSPEGSILRQLAYHAMVTASVATVVFNANPLMKFDGYYMLADLLETPNLMQRSQQMLHYLAQRYVLRLERARCPSTLPGEKALLTTYGVLAGLYRILLFLTITLFILGEWFIIGLALAVWTTAAWFMLPLGKLAHWLATASITAEHRARTIAITLACTAGIALLVGAVPLPDWRRGTGVVESLTRAGVYFQTDGFVRQAFVRPGDKVEEGQVIAVLDSYELDRLERANRAELADARVQLKQAMSKDDAGMAAVAKGRVAALERQLAEVADRRDHLTVRAPESGVVVGGDPMLLIGAFVRRGEPLCGLVDPARVRVAATLPQGEGAWFYQLKRDEYTVRMLTATEPLREVPGLAVTAPQAAQTEVPHAALLFAGGGQIEPDQQDRNGRTAKRPQITLYVEPGLREGDGSIIGKPGERVRLLFTLPSKPIVSQVIDRVQKVLQGRVNL
jgi:putative peptide zinc metalloprotease protein